MNAALGCGDPGGAAQSATGLRYTAGAVYREIALAGFGFNGIRFNVTLPR
jgi:hypothetical protein